MTPSKLRSTARHCPTTKMSGRPSLLASIFSPAFAVSQASCVMVVSRRVTPPVAAPAPAAVDPEQPAIVRSTLAQARQLQLLDSSVFFICLFPIAAGFLAAATELRVLPRSVAPVQRPKGATPGL